jgi:hypothetical protein
MWAQCYWTSPMCEHRIRATLLRRRVNRSSISARRGNAKERDVELETVNMEVQSRDLLGHILLWHRIPNMSSAKRLIVSEAM